MNKAKFKVADGVQWFMFPVGDEMFDYINERLYEHGDQPGHIYLEFDCTFHADPEVLRTAIAQYLRLNRGRLFKVVIDHQEPNAKGGDA